MHNVNKFLTKNSKYSVTIIRISLALVLLWFGLNQLFAPDMFIGYIPQYAMPHHAGMMHSNPIHLHDNYVTANSLLAFNGILEIILGISLLIGFYTRIAAFVAALHLFIIAISLGYNDILIRDLGLALMAVSLVFSGGGEFSLDNKNKLE